MKSHILIFICIPILLSLGACKQSAHKETKTDSQITSRGPLQVSEEGREASCVNLTKDENSIPLISWVEIDTASHKKRFYFAKLDTAKKKFGQAVSIPIPQNTSIHEEGMPKIAVKGDGTLVALFETSDPLKGRKWGLGDVRYIQSFDQGKTWTSPQSVAPKDYAAHRSSSFSGMTRLSDGEIGIAWLGTAKDPAQEGRPVKFTKTVGRDSIEPPIFIDHKACECCRVSLDGNAKGDVIIAFRDLRKGQIRDISVSLSKDNGTNFGPPISFSHDHWKIRGCPHNGPAVLAQGNRFFVTWFTGKEKISGVHYAELDSLGKVKTRENIAPEGQFIQIGLMPNSDRLLAYSEVYRDDNQHIRSKIMVERTDGKKAFRKEVSLPDSQANYPMIEAVDKTDIVVAWVAGGQVFYRRLPAESIDEPVGKILDLLSSGKNKTH